MWKLFNKIVALTLTFFMIFEQSGFAQVPLQIQLPAYINGYVAADRFRPVQLRSLSFDSGQQNFNLFLDKGDQIKIDPGQITRDAKQLMQYFRIGLALPNDTFWVNLRPDAADQIIDQFLEKTDVGQVMLAADLQLKKDLAGFTSPNNEEGRLYWDKLYAKANTLFNEQEISIPTVTRPWIVPGEVILQDTNSGCHIFKASLKVCLEQDYINDSKAYNFDDPRLKELNDFSSQLIRALIIPKLTREVNSSKKYASLRQVYYSLILAQWFKEKYRGQINKYSKAIDGFDLNGLTSAKSWNKEKYFNAYKKSFKKGEYNISENRYTAQGASIRQYFSGGMKLANALPLGNGVDGFFIRDGGVSLDPANELVQVTDQGPIIKDGGTQAPQAEIKEENLVLRPFIELWKRVYYPGQVKKYIKVLEAHKVARSESEQAAEMLGKLGDQSAKEPLTKYLVQVVLGDDYDVSPAAEKSLRQLGVNDNDIEKIYLSAFLNANNHPLVRMHAIEILGKQSGRSQSIKELLLYGKETESPFAPLINRAMNKAVLRIYRRVQREEILEETTSSKTKQDGGENRGMDLWDSESVGRVIKRLKSESSAEREMAARELGKMNAKQAVEALKEALRTEKVRNVRNTIAYALAKIDKNSLIDLLEGNALSPYARNAAEMALSDLKRNQNDGGSADITEGLRQWGRNSILEIRLLSSGIEFKEMLMIMAKLEDVPENKQDQFRKAYYGAVKALTSVGLRGENLQRALDSIKGNSYQKYSLDEQIDFAEQLNWLQWQMDLVGVKKSLLLGSDNQAEALIKLISLSNREQMIDVLTLLLPLLFSASDNPALISGILHELVWSDSSEKVMRILDIIKEKNDLSAVFVFLSAEARGEILATKQSALIFSRMLQLPFGLAAVEKIIEVGKENRIEPKEIMNLISTALYWGTDASDPFGRQVIENLGTESRKDNFEFVNRLLAQNKPLAEAGREWNRYEELSELQAFLKPIDGEVQKDGGIDRKIRQLEAIVLALDQRQDVLRQRIAVTTDADKKAIQEDFQRVMDYQQEVKQELESLKAKKASTPAISWAKGEVVKDKEYRIKKDSLYFKENYGMPRPIIIIEGPHQQIMGNWYGNLAKQNPGPESLEAMLRDKNIANKIIARNYLDRLRDENLPGDDPNNEEVFYGKIFYRGNAYKELVHISELEEWDGSFLDDPDWGKDGGDAATDEQKIVAFVEDLTNSDPSVRAVAYEGLGKMNKLSETLKIIRYVADLSDPDSDVRLSAAFMFGKIGNPQTLEVLLLALKDRDKFVRMVAAASLGKINNPKAVQPLIEVLSDTDKDLRLVAAEALGNIVDSLAIAHLENVRADQIRNIMTASSEELNSTVESKAIKQLVGTLADPDSEVRLVAVQVLGKIANPLALEPLIKLLSDPDRQVRLAAVEALGNIGDQKAIEPLHIALANFEVKERYSVVLALQEITHKNKKSVEKDGGAKNQAVDEMIAKNLEVLVKNTQWKDMIHRAKGIGWMSIRGICDAWGAIEMLSSEPILAEYVGKMGFEVVDGKVYTNPSANQAINANYSLIKAVLEGTFRELDKKFVQEYAQGQFGRDGGLLSTRQKRILLEEAKEQISQDSSMSLFQQRIALEGVTRAVQDETDVKDELNKSSVLSVRNVDRVTKMVKDIKDGGKTQTPEAPGGIDFRALPVVPSAGSALVPGAGVAMPKVSLNELDDQWKKIQRTAQNAELPYEQMKQFVSCCKYQEEAAGLKQEVAAYVVNLLKLEEERAIATPEALKEIVALVAA